MEITRFVTPEQRAVLARARGTYGDTTQILVTNEELCELAAVCAKYPRYNNKQKAVDELYTKALDEVADVLIVLDHVVNIFQLNPEDIARRVSGKIDRLNRWMNESDSMEQTTVDRKVDEATIPEECMKCLYNGDTLKYRVGPCKDCGPNYKHFTNKLPCKKCVRMGDYKSLRTCIVCVDNGGTMFEPRKDCGV